MPHVISICRAIYSGAIEIGGLCFIRVSVVELNKKWKYNAVNSQKKVFENLIKSARKKLLNKSCDWIIANNHIQKNQSVFNNDMNEVSFLTNESEENWGLVSKQSVAENLCNKIVKFFDSPA